MSIGGIEIANVDDLYDEHARFGTAIAPDRTSYNPLDGRVGVIPRNAKHYAMVLEHEESKIDLARRLIKGLVKRRSVKSVVVEKAAVNFNQFARPGRVVVLYA